MTTEKLVKTKKESFYGIVEETFFLFNLNILYYCLHPILIQIDLPVNHFHPIFFQKPCLYLLAAEGEGSGEFTFCVDDAKTRECVPDPDSCAAHFLPLLPSSAHQPWLRSDHRSPHDLSESVLLLRRSVWLTVCDQIITFGRSSGGSPFLGSFRPE